MNYYFVAITISTIVAVIIFVILALYLTGVLPMNKNNAAATTTTTLATTTKAPSATYLGCYSDSSSSRVFPSTLNGVATVNQCNAAAKAAGSPFFGMQYWQQGGSTIGDTAQCWYGNSSSNKNTLQQNGINTSCAVGTDSNYYGGAYANALYSIF